MRKPTSWISGALSLVLMPGGVCFGAELVFRRVPDEGIQPRLVTDARGDVHLLYFREQDDQVGHLFYRRYLAATDTWSDAIQASTTALPRPEVIARASMAVDRDARVHVSWYRPQPTAVFPTPAWFRAKPTYLYARSLEGSKMFEPERAMLSEYVTGAETSAELALHGNTVSLVWHGGHSALQAVVESSRSVYRRVSQDHGDTFGDEEIIGDPDLGACLCCGLSADHDETGNLLVAYRTAIDGEGRHIQLLSVGSNEAASTTLIHPWELNACPVTTSAVARSQAGDNWLVFETRGQLYQTTLESRPAPSLVKDTSSSPRPTRQKHPSLAFNAHGEKVVVWTEGAGFFGGGTLNWQLFDATGEPVLSAAEHESRQVPDNSAAAVTALKDGSFLIVY